MILLAVLNNIVVAIGGNTAIQSLTVVTRGLALGDFHLTSKTKVFFKEVLSGLSIGIITGVFIAVVIYLWKGNIVVSSVLAVAMILNCLIAACFGSLIPIFLKKLNMDPAAGSGVICTMITDLFGFFCFLGLASLAFQWVGNF